jgi:SRSO17 transposase
VVTAEQVQGWDDDLREFFLGFSHWFSRADVRWQAWKYVRGLLAPIERRSGWSLAEHAGDKTPDRMQGLLVSRCFDRDAVRDQVRSALVSAIGDETGVLIADETGFIKKGKASAGVQRQYTGTSGKIDNCQLGVFLAYHTAKGRALIDRELYLPTSWTDDQERCAKAHVPETVEFATKPEQARSMLQRAVKAGVPFGWFTGDEATGRTGPYANGANSRTSPTCWPPARTMRCPPAYTPPPASTH